MPPRIPPRHSSLAALEDARLQNKMSQQDLKRKLSDSTLEKGSEKRIRLYIEGKKLELEELELERERMEWEMNAKNVDEKLFRKAQRTTNSRVISLGDDLWQFKKQLRLHREKAGELELLTPDSENAYAAALLHLYKDPKKSKNRDRTTQSNMTRDTIAAYHSLDVENAGVRCTLSGEYFDSDDIKAAHIVPLHLGIEMADYIFGKGTGARLSSVDNCLMLHKKFEAAFDKGMLAFVPVNPAERPIRRWKAILLNDAARNQAIMHFDTMKKIGDADGMELKFLSEQRPAARFLYYHFVVSLLRCRRQRDPGWENSWVNFRTGQPWPTPGRYLRQSMLLALAGTVGDLDNGEIEGLVKERTFDVPERLADDEEKEVARRMLEAQQQREEMCQRRAELAALGLDEDDDDDDEDNDEEGGNERLEMKDEENE